ncbi:MAG: dihydroorotate dehydrogenase-like protein [Bacteroidetes bacterium]|nr:dihydroorotate dehydrogenase-like protein [Bacteroidota bacterium]
MANLKTTYMGLELKNPVIIGSSGLTQSVSAVKKLADNGAGAVVLKSLFEEQILLDAQKTAGDNQNDYPGAEEYIAAYTKDKQLVDFLDFVGDTKKAVDIPVIASINCVSDSDWISYAAKIEEAGVDALELNVAILPSSVKTSSAENEKKYFAISEKVKAKVSIPVSLKMSHYSAGLAKLIQQLSFTGHLDGFVLFNRYYRPDIDIVNMKLTTSSIYSTPDEIAASLRWIALLSGSIETDLVASTGVHDGAGVIKQLLAGANAVQLVSAIYERGAEYIREVLKDIEEWMDQKGYKNIEDFRGILSYDLAQNPAVFERTQFMKYYSELH